MIDHEHSRNDVKNIQKKFLKKIGAMMKICDNWRIIVGEDASLYTKPVKYIDNCLHVVIESPEWGVFLRMEDVNIRDMLEKELNIPVKKIVPVFFTRKRSGPTEKKKSKEFKQLDNKEIDKILKEHGEKNSTGFLLSAILKKNSGEDK